MTQLPGKALTLKSILFSLLGVIVVSGLSGFHDEVFFGGTLMVGSHLPVAAFTFMVALGLGWNLFASRIVGLIHNSQAGTRILLFVVQICSLWLPLLRHAVQGGWFHPEGDRFSLVVFCVVWVPALLLLGFRTARRRSAHLWTVFIVLYFQCLFTALAGDAAGTDLGSGLKTLFVAFSLAAWSIHFAVFLAVLLWNPISTWYIRHLRGMRARPRAALLVVAACALGIDPVARVLLPAFPSVALSFAMLTPLLVWLPALVSWWVTLEERTRFRKWFGILLLLHWCVRAGGPVIAAVLVDPPPLQLALRMSYAVGVFGVLMLPAYCWVLFDAFMGEDGSLALSTRELIVVMIVSLIACYPPTSGLFRYFHRALVLPWYWLNTGGRVEWTKFGVLESLPGKIFPAPAPVVKDGVLSLDAEVYRGFWTGMAQGSQMVPFGELPWGGWMSALVYWGPLVVFAGVCVISMALLVHRQWSRHEQLSYPVAQVALSFVERRDGRRGIPDVFRSRLFWWGFLPIFLLYCLDYLNRWFPNSVPGISTLLPNFRSWGVPLTAKLPVLKKMPYNWALANQTIYFSVVGLAYFVSAEISLTMGLHLILLGLVSTWFFNATGKPLSSQDLNVSRAGAYIGYALILCYTGRTYFSAVFKRAFLFRGRGEKDDPSVMAARLMVIAFVGMVATMTLMGTDWLMATIYSLLLMLLFLVFTRIICETGIPFLQCAWVPGTLMVSLLGPAAMGPGPLVFLLWVSSVLVQDPRECLMPYAATGIRMADDGGLRLKRVYVLLIGALLLALTAAFISSTWTFYNFGAMRDGYASRSVPQEHFNRAAREISSLQETGMLEASAAARGLGKLRLIAPEPSDMGYLVAGMGLVIGLSMLRFRFAGFPLHPVLFLTWGTYASAKCWAAFLMGWFIKTLVVRFGGGRVYQQIKPLFIGVIAGELVAAGISILIDMVYYWVTGTVSNIGFNILAG